MLHAPPGDGRVRLPGLGLCPDTCAFCSKGSTTGWVPVARGGSVEEFVQVSAWHDPVSYAHAHAVPAGNTTLLSAAWELIWCPGPAKLMSEYLCPHDIAKCKCMDQWSACFAGGCAGAFAQITARAVLSVPIVVPSSGFITITTQRRVKVVAVSDCPALQLGKGVLEGNATCPCPMCVLEKSSWQGVAKEAGGARSHSKCAELYAEHTMGHAKFDSRKHSSQKHLPFLPDVPLAPPVLHIFLGVGNSITDYMKAIARLCDDNIDKGNDRLKVLKSNIKRAIAEQKARRETHSNALAWEQSFIDSLSIAMGRDATVAGGASWWIAQL